MSVSHEIEMHIEHERVPIRPLGELSNFVVDRMPHVLADIHSGRTHVDNLSYAAGNLVQNLTSRTLDEVLANSELADVAGLDLKMLELGIVHSGGRAPAELMSLVDEFAAHTDQPGGLTYEEIVIINPSSDMRLFSHGDAGNTEAHFYSVHRVIEGHLDNTIAVVREGIDDLVYHGNERVEEVASSLAASVEPLVELGRGTHSLGEQSAEHFKVFRPYLSTHPLRGSKGPSGAFTAGIPALETYLSGSNLPSEYFGYLRENAEYFPRAGRLKIDQAVEAARQKRSLTDINNGLGNPEAITGILVTMSELLRRFRGEHYRAVRRQIPEALDGQAAGTGGEADPGEFLRSRMKMRHIS